MSPEHVAKALRRFQGEMEKGVVNAIRRRLHAARNEAIQGYRQRGVLRRIFEKKVGGLRTLVKRTRVTRRNGRVTAGLSAVGLAALAEKGGQTRAHAIPGAFGHRGSVQHPGGPVPANPQLVSAMKRALPDIRTALKTEAGVRAAKAAGL